MHWKIIFTNGDVEVYSYNRYYPNDCPDEEKHCNGEAGAVIFTDRNGGN